MAPALWDYKVKYRSHFCDLRPLMNNRVDKEPTGPRTDQGQKIVLFITFNLITYINWNPLEILEISNMHI